MNDIMNNIVTFLNELWTTKGHKQWIMNGKRAQFSVMNDTMNDIVNDKKGHNIMNDKPLCSQPDGLLVVYGLNSMRLGGLVQNCTQNSARATLVSFNWALCSYLEVVYYLCMLSFAFLPTATKLWPRLCFYSCLWFCTQGGSLAGRTPRQGDPGKEAPQ